MLFFVTERIVLAAIRLTCIGKVGGKIHGSYLGRQSGLPNSGFFVLFLQCLKANIALLFIYATTRSFLVFPVRRLPLQTIYASRH